MANMPNGHTVSCQILYNPQNNATFRGKQAQYGNLKTNKNRNPQM